LKENTMLHAVIRTRNEAFHFFAEPDLYNLETLQQHVRGARRDSRQVKLEISFDPPSGPDIARRVNRWLHRLSRVGVSVELDGRHLPSAPPAGRAAMIAGSAYRSLRQR
jgi:hypothetical protein